MIGKEKGENETKLIEKPSYHNLYVGTGHAALH